ncbi:MAG: type 1 periplasmic binding fold superfamily protein [Bacteroidota bacterium]
MSIYQKILLMAFVSTAFLFTACGDDDVVVDDGEELITTLTMVLQPNTGGTAQTVSFTDLDGDGGDDPVIGSLTLEANTTYTTAVTFLNESETPAENVTEEIMEEDDEHQVFYAISSGLNLTVKYEDQDGEGNPLGLLTTITTGDAGSGALTVTLLHEPDKNADGVAEGSPTNAGGETDIEVVFPVEIQ